MHSRVFVALGLVAFVVGGHGAESRARPTRPNTTASTDTSTAYKGAIIMDAASGNVLFEDRADTVSAPASMTKLMTFAVLCDALQRGTLRMDTAVKITPEDAKMGGTQVFLDPRETFSVEELVYAMMIQSANDAAHALARASSGSVAAFVDEMNAKARYLGMTNTLFRTPHGLPPATRLTKDGDYTTPRDFAKLSLHLVQKTDVVKYTSIRSRAFGEGIREKPMAMTNHNHLLGKVDGVDGLKTGFTRDAGFCLAATAQRGSKRVIVVTMGSPDTKIRDLHVSNLIERGLALIPASSKFAAPAPAVAAATDSSPIRPAPLPSKPAPTEPVIKFSVPKR